jgi:hypothetical protein
MKLFQYDKKTWEDGDTDYTWQFGIVKNRSLLWVHYEYPSRLIHSNGGLHILLSFFTSSGFLGADFQIGRIGLGFNILTEYFDGWND